MLALRPQRRSPIAQLRYILVLTRRFRFTFIMLGLLVLGGGSLTWELYRRAGLHISFPRALATAYFLLFAQPLQEPPDYGPIYALYALIPPLGIVTVADGLLRFAILIFAKQRDDKEWFMVLAQSLRNHVIVIGAGRVGVRIFEQYRKLDIPLVFLERKAEGPFVVTLREAGVPLLAEDGRNKGALERANIAQARAIICATDDDLANLNIALDAKRLNPKVRVVMRLFDDDLVARAKGAFDVEAFSTSALAAPALAIAALDPDIRNSFELGGRHLVIAEMGAGELAGQTVQDAAKRGLTVLHVARSDGTLLHDPPLLTPIGARDRLAVQATLGAYQKFRNIQ